MPKFLITGGAGFIGSAVARLINGTLGYPVVVVDKLTYSGNLKSLAAVANNHNFDFVRQDICVQSRMLEIFRAHQPDVVMHLAAESHVDRSIDAPAAFMQTNILGTFSLLEAARIYLAGLGRDRRATFRFHHVSTDEVFGQLGPTSPKFCETTPYAPSSPYSASKAASDHLARAWHATYGVPVVISNCSNNYGPYHFPEKLIPLVIVNALEEQSLPIYGDGANIRDWVFVDDHARALLRVATAGTVGESYIVGADAECTNLEIVKTICRILDELHPRAKGGAYEELIMFVTDRPGHDQRYAVDATKITQALGWVPQESLESGLRKTVAWYLENETWWRPIREQHYGGARLGAIG